MAAYTVSLLNAKIIRDLDLRRAMGSASSSGPYRISCPCPTARFLKVAPGRTRAGSGKILRPRRRAARRSTRRGWSGWRTSCARSRSRRRPTWRRGRELIATLGALVDTAKVATRLRSLGLEGQRDCVEIFTRSAGDFLDQWFESDPIKAILGFDGIVGTYASPYAAGTAYVLLHHCFGEVNGKKGVWGHAIGGMGAIAQAMARALRQRAGSKFARAPRSARFWWRRAAPPAS